jgi:hypothetical protein
MGFINSLSSTITCIMTTTGRAVLARNDGSFRVTKFKVADDEINYQLYDPASIDTEDADIVSIPILEPSTNPDTALRFPLVTMPEGTRRVAELIVGPNNTIVNMNSRQDVIKMTAQTLYNEDLFYIVSFTNVSNSYINTINVTKADNNLTVTKSADAANSNEYLISTNHSLQSSNASWLVNIAFKNTTSSGIESADSAAFLQVAQKKQNILLATVIVMGQQSGMFTTMDIYGNFEVQSGTIGATGGSITPTIGANEIGGGGRVIAPGGFNSNQNQA